MPIVFVGAAALRPSCVCGLTRSTSPTPRRRTDAHGDERTPLRELFSRPSVAMAIVALAVGQAVMVLIMTMTPLHMREHGHGLGAVGFVISAHTFGMFALSPVSDG